MGVLRLGGMNIDYAHDRELIGREVKVTIDRAMGTIHPNWPSLFYSLNYGYIDGIVAPDGDYLDAYVLGVLDPVAEFVGI